MSLAVFIGVFVAQIAISMALGTALLYVAARCWRAPTMSWGRALALCFPLDATSICGAIVTFAIGAFALRRGATIGDVLLVFSVGLATLAVQWYWVIVAGAAGARDGASGWRKKLEQLDSTMADRREPIEADAYRGTIVRRILWRARR